MAPLPLTTFQTNAGPLRLPVIDAAGLDDLRGKVNVTFHWSAGTHAVTQDCLDHYHFILDGAGLIHHGVAVENNLVYAGHPRSAQYAAHVKNANTNNIAISAAAMAGSAESAARKGVYGPNAMTAAQVEGLVEVAAHICYHFDIPVLPTRVLGHEEWDSVLGRPQDRWDVNCIPHLDIRPHLNPDGTYDSTNFLRQRVRQRLAQLNQQTAPVPTDAVKNALVAHLAGLYSAVPTLGLSPEAAHNATRALNAFNAILVENGIKD